MDTMMSVATVFIVVLTFLRQIEGKDVRDFRLALFTGRSHNRPKHGWDYAERGPSTWSGVCSTGLAQSPINIVTSETEKASSSNRVFSHNYWKMTDQIYTIKNNGHAIQIDLPKDNLYELKKGMNNIYIPMQIHIHFNAETGQGSEHTLNWKKYFAEIHIVHRNAKYTTTEQMKGNKDGLLVIGIFVDLVKGFDLPSSDLDFSMKNLVSKIKTPNNRTSFAMHLFGLAARRLKNPNDGKVVEIHGFPLAWLLPTKTRDTNSGSLEYVNYKGSLTTPPCSEVVDWIVLTGRTLEISDKAAQDFMTVKNSIGTAMSGNFRPVQDLNGRKVYGVKGMI